MLIKRMNKKVLVGNLISIAALLGFSVFIKGNINLSNIFRKRPGRRQIHRS